MTETNPNAGAIEKTASAALVAAGFGDAKGQGTEKLGLEDVRPPRLGLAQSNSPQAKKGHVKQIEGVGEGDLFNDLTGENYKEGPLEILVLQFLGLRAMEFFPLPPNGPGGIKDRNVSTERRKDDPRRFVDERLNWQDHPTEKDPSGKPKRVKPAATLFYDYLVYVPKTGEVMSLSMKNTQLKVAIDLNSIIKLPLRIDGELVPTPPAWARLIALSSAMEHKETFDYANFRIKQLGIAPKNYRDEAAALFEVFRDKNVVIEREGDAEEEKSDEDVPF